MTRYTVGAKGASLPVNKKTPKQTFYYIGVVFLAVSTEICNSTDDHAANVNQSKEIPALNLSVISIRISLRVSMALLKLLYF